TPGKFIKKRFAVDIIDDNVDSPISAQVSKCGSAAAARIVKPAFLRANQAESAVTQIRKQLVLLKVAITSFARLRINMPVRDKQFLPAIVVKIGETCTPREVLVTDRPQPSLERHVLESTAVIVIQRVVVLGEVGHEEVKPAVVIVIPDRDAHVRLGSPICTERTPSLESDFLECSVSLVMPKVIRHRIVRHKNVGPAIVVEIQPNHTQSVSADRISHTRVLANFAKFSVSFIVIEQIRKTGKSTWSAGDRC